MSASAPASPSTGRRIPGASTWAGSTTATRPHAALVEVDAAAAEADAALLEAIMLEGMREALGADAPVRVDVRVCSSWAGVKNSEVTFACAVPSLDL